MSTPRRVASDADLSTGFCDHFIEVAGVPWAGTYCKRLAGHGGTHVAHYVDYPKAAAFDEPQEVPDA